jgi:TRAP-type uncharacterized transport system fused permease subunit
MAEVLGVPYSMIVIAAIVPAVDYYLSLLTAVDSEAVRAELRGFPIFQRLGRFFKKNFCILFPWY